MVLIISLLIAGYFSLPVCCSGDEVSEAINICRNKLKNDPHFPKVQHSLAQLLDSQLSDDVDISLVAEVVQLYRGVGKPHSDVDEKRIPPAKGKSFKVLIVLSLRSNTHNTFHSSSV